MSILILVLIVALVGGAVFIYNRLIGQIEAVKNSEAQIDVQLDRRFKVFESLINSVKKAMDYEQTVLKDVVALRSQAQEAKEAGDTKTRIEAENKLSAIAGNLKFTFEQYPQLKAVENIAQLQEEIASTENRLALAKQAYNDALETYYASKKSFFTQFVVKIFAGALDKTFEYWKLDAAEAKKLDQKVVTF